MLVQVKVNQATVIYLTKSGEVQTVYLITDTKLNQSQAKEQLKDIETFKKIVDVTNEKVTKYVDIAYLQDDSTNQIDMELGE